MTRRSPVYSDSQSANNTFTAASPVLRTLLKSSNKAGRKGAIVARIRSCSAAPLGALSFSTLFLGTLLLSEVFISVEPAKAQVVYSVGVQEVYDDNIFLEGSKGPVLPAAGTEGEIPFFQTEQFDGKKNDDFITNITLGMSSALELSPHFRTALGGQVGFLLFSDYSDQNRLTVDAAFEASTLPSILPEPFGLSFSNRISSTNSRQTAAAGTATQQAQQNDATLALSVAPQEVATRTSLDGNIRVGRHDFLGDFLLNESDDENRFDPDGADYFDFGTTVSLKHQLNERTHLFFDNSVSYQVFTGGGQSDFLEGEDDQIDRLNYRPSVGASYLATEGVVLSGSVGLDLTHFDEKPSPRTVAVFVPDGAPILVTSDPDSTQTNLFFSTAAAYSPTADLSLRLGVDQSAGTDIDGNRVLVRSVFGNVNYLITDKLSVGSGGRYSQYSGDDSLSRANDQYEGSVYLRYALAPTWAIAAGYNYVRQDSDDGAQNPFFGDGSYESNRVFVSLDTGFVGMFQ